MIHKVNKRYVYSNPNEHTDFTILKLYTNYDLLLAPSASTYCPRLNIHSFHFWFHRSFFTVWLARLAWCCFHLFVCTRRASTSSSLSWVLSLGSPKSSWRNTAVGQPIPLCYPFSRRHVDRGTQLSVGQSTLTDYSSPISAPPSLQGGLFRLCTSPLSPID